jgi:hypothetical protein
VGTPPPTLCVASRRLIPTSPSNGTVPTPQALAVASKRFSRPVDCIFGCRVDRRNTALGHRPLREVAFARMASGSLGRDPRHPRSTRAHSVHVCPSQSTFALTNALTLALETPRFSREIFTFALLRQFWSLGPGRRSRLVPTLCVGTPPPTLCVAPRRLIPTSPSAGTVPTPQALAVTSSDSASISAAQSLFSSQPFFNDSSFSQSVLALFRQ